MVETKEVITFKIDKSLAKLMRGIDNRSAFIRTAILSALNSLCPFCKGSGVLTPHRQRHWKDFSSSHALETCGECESVVAECGSKS